MGVTAGVTLVCAKFVKIAVIGEILLRRRRLVSSEPVIARSGRAVLKGLSTGVYACGSHRSRSGQPGGYRRQPQLLYELPTIQVSRFRGKFRGRYPGDRKFPAHSSPFALLMSVIQNRQDAIGSPVVSGKPASGGPSPRP